MNIHSLFPDIQNQKLRFVLALGANLAVTAVCLMYSGGAAGMWAMMITVRLLLFMLDLWACTRLWQIITLGVLHIAATYCVERQTTWLYLKYISNDSETAAVGEIGAIVGVVLAVITAVALAAVFILKNRQERKTLL